MNGFYRQIPKAELHVHLRGSITAQEIFSLAQKYGVKKRFDESFTEAQKNTLRQTPTIDRFIKYGDSDLESNSREAFDKLFEFNDYLGFLRTYFLTGMFFKDASDLELLARAVVDRFVDDGIVYSEVSVSLKEYLNLGLSIEDVCIVLENTKLYALNRGLVLLWIVDLVRNYGAQECLALMRQVHEQCSPTFTGITIGGNEREFPPEDFVGVFSMAKDCGFKLSIHSGEALGPESIRKVLRDIAPDRIGHGVRAVEDPRLCDELARTGIPLEVCPTSNILLGLYADYTTHPVKELFSRGVNVTLNTDDPGFFDVTLSQEISNSEESGLSKKDLKTILRSGFTSAFITDTVLKKQLVKSYDSFQWPGDSDGI